MGKPWTEEEAIFTYNFSQNFKYMMREKNIGRTELSRRTGISTGIIGCYILGRIKPRQDRIELLAKALGCEVDDLTKEYDYRMPGCED